MTMMTATRITETDDDENEKRRKKLLYSMKNKSSGITISEAYWNLVVFCWHLKTQKENVDI